MGTIEEQLKCKIIGKVELPQGIPTEKEKAVIVTGSQAFGDYIKKYAKSWGYNEVTQHTPVIRTAKKKDIKNKYNSNAQVL